MMTIENVEVSFEVDGDEDEQKLKRLIQSHIRSQLQRQHEQQSRDGAARRDRSLVPRSEDMA